MAERPILFSAPMVRALLAGTKTQTRRVVKPIPRWAEQFPICKPDVMAAGHQIWWWNGEHDGVGVSQDCPYGAPGDVLWVKETYRLTSGDDALKPSDARREARYAADHGAAIPAGFGKLRPSIHMPRWASRISLTITDVRVERLNDISVRDAVAEGMTFPEGMEWGSDPIDAFTGLWRSINGPGSWEANPWVWAVRFVRSTPDV